MTDDIVKRLLVLSATLAENGYSAPSIPDAADEIERLRAEVGRLTRERDEAQAKLDADLSHDFLISVQARAEAAEWKVDALCKEVAELRSRPDALRADVAEQKVTVLRTALKEATDLRVKLYRNGDILGEDDDLSDEQIAKKETYARKWSAALAETEKN